MPARNDHAWRRLAALASWMAVGWAAALLYHYVAGVLLGLPYPATTFLFDPHDRFNDLVNTWLSAQAPDPYAAGGRAVAAYFPLVYAILGPFGDVQAGWVVLAYLLAAVAAAAAVGAAWIVRERPRWAGDTRWAIVPVLVLFVVLANYPFVMAVDRGNLEPFIVALVAAALLALDGGWTTVAGVLLGLSAGAKGYPIVAALLWVRRGRWAGAAAAVTTLALAIVLPALLFPGGVAGTLRGLADGLATFRAAYVLGPLSAHYSADGLNAIRVLAAALGWAPDFTRVVAGWEAFAALWAALLCVDALLVARAPWRQALAVCLVMLVFPNVANDYKVMVLLPPVLAWLACDEPWSWRDRVFVACAALLFVPKHYGPPLALPDATISCVVSPLLVLGLTATLWPTAEERAEARERLGRGRALLRRRRAAQGTGA